MTQALSLLLGKARGPGAGVEDLMRGLKESKEIATSIRRTLQNGHYSEFEDGKLSEKFEKAVLKFQQSAAKTYEKNTNAIPMVESLRVGELSVQIVNTYGSLARAEACMHYYRELHGKEYKEIGDEVSNALKAINRDRVLELLSQFELEASHDLKKLEAHTEKK